MEDTDQSSGQQGDLRGLLCYALVCAFVPLCLCVHTVRVCNCAGMQGCTLVSVHLYVCIVSGSLCICVCEFTI